jgi:C1A family cysteine protease
MTKEIKPIDRILNCVPSKSIEEDWTFKNAIDADILAGPAALPPSVDLREDWWGIGDQADHGACVGFATADSLLRWHFVKKNLLPKNKRLSVRFVWMASKEMDEFDGTPSTFLEAPGTSLKSALNITRRYGCVAESMLPFEPIKLFHGPPKTFFADASKLKIANYFNLRKPTDDWEATKNNWRTWLATTGPIITALGVDATWDNADKTNGNLDVYKPDTVRGGHAIALVGYTSDRFIVRNSWGVGWGDKGFGYASDEYAKAAFAEAYGITV